MRYVKGVCKAKVNVWKFLPSLGLILTLIPTYFVSLYSKAALLLFGRFFKKLTDFCTGRSTLRFHAKFE